MANLIFMSDASLSQALIDLLREKLAGGLGDAVGKTQVDWNVVRPGGTISTDHIVDVAPRPWFNFFAEFHLPEFLSESAVTDLAAALAEHPPASAGRILTLVSHCRETPPVSLGSAGLLSEYPGFVKQVCLIKRRADISRSDFVQYYEAKHAPLAAELLPQFMNYSRNFVVPDAIFSNDRSLAEELTEFDVITQMCFRSVEAHREFQGEFAKPEIGIVFAQDEEKLFDRSRISMFLVDIRSVMAV